jgi:hypothetical protein
MAVSPQTPISPTINQICTCNDPPSQYSDRILTEPSGKYQKLEYTFINGFVSKCSTPASHILVCHWPIHSTIELRESLVAIGYYLMTYNFIVGTCNIFFTAPVFWLRLIISTVTNSSNLKLGKDMCVLRARTLYIDMSCISRSKRSLIYLASLMWFLTGRKGFILSFRYYFDLLSSDSFFFFSS